MTEREEFVSEVYINRTGTPPVKVPMSQVCNWHIARWVMDDFEIHSGAHGKKEDPTKCTPEVAECIRRPKHGRG